MDNLDNESKSNTNYSQTVFATMEQLSCISDNILETYQDYLSGKLISVTKEEVIKSLELWFSKKDGRENECSVTPDETNVQLKTGDTKRQRGDSNV